MGRSSMVLHSTSTRSLFTAPNGCSCGKSFQQSRDRILVHNTPLLVNASHPDSFPYVLVTFLPTLPVFSKSSSSAVVMTCKRRCPHFQTSITKPWKNVWRGFQWPFLLLSSALASLYICISGRRMSPLPVHQDQRIARHRLSKIKIMYGFCVQLRRSCTTPTQGLSLLRTTAGCLHRVRFFRSHEHFFWHFPSSPRSSPSTVTWTCM
jgi:hypothetical protein